MSQDPLQLCPIEKWSELQEIFAADWPRSISAFTVLQTQKKLILDCGLDYGFKVYCPFGDGKNGMVAMNVKKTFYEVIVQCPSNDTSKLELALRTTSIIDWDRHHIEVPFAPANVMMCIHRVIKDKKLNILTINTTTTYILDKTSPLFNVTLPPGFTFDLLSLDHVALLDSTWPHQYPNSDFYFELLIKAKLGYGLFKEQKLVSWVLVKEMGALLHLYTLQEERRKGYAEMVLKLISDILLKDNKCVVAFCVTGNENAAKLYQKLNFLATDDVQWCNFGGKKQTK